MKRTLSLLLILLLLSGLSLSAYAAEETSAPVPELTLSADMDSLSPGETVTLTLTLDQPLSELNNYQFNLLYDASRFELSGSEAAEPTVVSAPRKDEVSGKDCITLSGLSTEGLPVELAAGNVAALSFTALDGAEPGEAEFTVCTQALPSYADPTAAAALDVVNDAVVTVNALSAIVPGDVSGDGSINGVDAVLILKYAANTLQTEFSIAAADVNGDGAVNGVDAVLVLKYAAGTISKFPIQ